MATFKQALESAYNHEATYLDVRSSVFHSVFLQDDKKHLLYRRHYPHYSYMARDLLDLQEHLATLDGSSPNFSSICWLPRMKTEE